MGMHFFDEKGIEKKDFMTKFSEIYESLDDERYKEYHNYIEQQKNKDFIENLKRRGIPLKFLEESIDTYKSESETEKIIKQDVVKFIKSPKNKMLIMCGENGTGKTHLGTAIIRELGGVYINSFKFGVEYEMGGAFDAKKNRLDILDYYSRVKVLVIDEVGRGKVDFEKEVLPYIINQRYENNLPTVIITNFPKKEIVKYFGKAIFDRMTEICTCIEFTGKSYRATNRDKIFSEK